MKNYNKDTSIQYLKMHNEYGMLSRKQIIHCKLYVAVLCSLTLGLGAVFARFVNL